MPPDLSSKKSTVDGYKIRIWLPGIYPIIWRRFLFRADNTFADLHYAIQIACNWSDDFLHRFVLQNTTIGIPRAHGYPVVYSAEIATLSDFRLRKNQRFVYEYNFIDYWQIEVRIEELLILDASRLYPICSGGTRAAPPESCGGPKHFLRLRAQILDAAANADLQDNEWIDQGGQQATSLTSTQQQYWMNTDRFDRHLVNRRLKQYAVGDNRWRHG